MSTVTTQFRRYEVRPGDLDSFIACFPKIRAARHAHGFEVLFAYASRETNEFCWAVAHPGDVDDFNATFARYMESPERAAAFVDNPRKWMLATHATFVDTVDVQ